MGPYFPDLGFVQCRRGRRHAVPGGTMYQTIDATRHLAASYVFVLGTIDTLGVAMLR